MTAATPRNDSGAWRVSPEAADHYTFAWDGGVYEAARRTYTDAVEGTILSSRHIVMATLRGGARRHEIKTDCGHRYAGPDRAGAVSFLPAACERALRLRGVAWEWASIAIVPELFSRIESSGDPGDAGPELHAFSNVEDAFLFGLLCELERLRLADGRLDATYCDAMTIALVRYLNRRYGRGAAADREPPAKLSPWRLRRISDYVDAHLDQEIRIPALASLVGLSEGHLHRAFRITTGQTPLQFINQKRVSRAMEILAAEPAPIADLALRVGFSSPSHFARIFRMATGAGPSEFRKNLQPGASCRSR